MRFLTFKEYSKIAYEATREPYPKQFQTNGPGSDVIMKRHPGQVWRPIEWCDMCKGSIKGGLVFDEDDRVALCHRCAGVPTDKESAAALGIML